METLHKVSEMYKPKIVDHHDTSQPILTLDDVWVRYNGGFALEQISFELQRGERIAVIGPNGAGKSSLFNVIAGVLKPFKGQVKIYGNAPGQHICIAYVPQRSLVDWHFPANVADVVMMGRVGKIGPFKWPGHKDREIVKHAINLVGMDHLSNRQIGELSGGQQQRVFIARALAQEAELVLMDEPLTGLDMKSQEDIFTILDKLRQHKVTILVATHDLNLAAEKFDQLLLLNKQIIGFGTAETVFTANLLNKAYSGHMHLLETAKGTVIISDTCCSGGEEYGNG